LIADNESCVNKDEQTPADVIHITQDISGQTLYGLHMLDVALFTLRRTNITRVFKNIQITAKMTHHRTFRLQVLLRRLVLGHVIQTDRLKDCRLQHQSTAVRLMSLAIIVALRPSCCNIARIKMTNFTFDSLGLLSLIPCQNLVHNEDARFEFYDNLAARTDLLKRGFIAPISRDLASFFRCYSGESQSHHQSVKFTAKTISDQGLAVAVALRQPWYTEHDCTACLDRRTTSSSNTTRRL
jgi:hypothetical protein